MDVLEHLKLKSIYRVSSIKTFNLSTLYTTIPHEQLQSSISGIIRSTFKKWFPKIQVCSRKHCIFVKDESDSPNKYSDIIRMVELLIDNIYVQFGGHVYQQTVGING